MADLGLHNYKNRFYNDDLGRFIQQDPLRFDAGDLNMYRYCGNDSINNIDPDGQFVQAVPWTAAEVTALGYAVVGAYVAVEALKHSDEITAATLQTIAAAKEKWMSAHAETPPSPKPSIKNPPTGEPNGEVTARNPGGTPKQVRRYGPDGRPETDVDHGHGHEKGADDKPVGNPHAHDWTPDENGGFPTRGPARPVQPTDPKPAPTPPKPRGPTE